MAKDNFSEQSIFEKTITDKLNEPNIGPLGLGGMSVLATLAKIDPKRANSMRIVALRPCCFEPRRVTIEL